MNIADTRGTPPPHARIALVDDDLPVLDVMTRRLRHQGYAALPFTSPAAFLSSGLLDSFNALLLDLRMPGMDGLCLQSHLTRAGCEVPVVFLTGFGEIPDCVQALRNGAIDFLCKPVDPPDLLRAIRNALEQDRSRRARRAHTAETQRCLKTLTPREREVMQCVVDGKINKQIADELGISEKTVKVHRGRVMRKMDAASVVVLCQTIFRHVQQF